MALFRIKCNKNVHTVVLRVLFFASTTCSKEEVLTRVAFVCIRRECIQPTTPQSNECICMKCIQNAFKNCLDTE